MIVKRSAGLLALAGCLMLVAGCSSSGPSAGPSPTSTILGVPGFDSELARAALVECSLHRGLITTSIIKNPKLTYPPRNLSKWYADGRVTYNIDFANWWGANQLLAIDGNSLQAWALLAAKQQKLPSQVCGDSAMPSPSPTPLPSSLAGGGSDRDRRRAGRLPMGDTRRDPCRLPAGTARPGDHCQPRHGCRGARCRPRGHRCGGP
jgi:hypothetical protein